MFRQFRGATVWLQCAIAALGLLGAASPALAQFDRGAISGTIVDQQGGVVPGVTVTAVQVQTQQSRITTTDASGFFTLPQLNPGLYNISAELDGEDPGSTRASVDAHLVGCPGCREYAAGAQRLHRSMRISPAEAVPDLSGSILRAIGDPRPVGATSADERTLVLRICLAFVAVIQLGIGIHLGFVMVGNLGSQDHLDYTVIGKTVNLAARLCGLARQSIVVSQAVRGALPGAPEFAFSGTRSVPVRGFKDPITVYDLQRAGA